MLARIRFVWCMWRLMLVFGCSYQVAVSIFCDALLLSVKDGADLSPHYYVRAAQDLGYGL